MLNVVQYLQSRIDGRFGVYRSPLIRAKGDKGENTRTQQGGKTMDGEQLHGCQDETATARSMTSAMVYGGRGQGSGVVGVARYFGDLPCTEGSSCHSGLPGPSRQTIGK